MRPFLDAWLAAPLSFTEAPTLPVGLAGALLFGSEGKARCDELMRWFPESIWRHAETLELIVGEDHARFPSRGATVIDLCLNEKYRDASLAHPPDWWPLCYPLRDTQRWIRLTLPPGSQVVVRVKQILKRYPETLFWLDPFANGPQPGWQGHVRLAEWPNAVISTLGLFPGRSAWTAEQAEDALAFVVGEVGAAKLLYASGCSWSDLACGRDRPAREWLESTPRLDDRERDLVLTENARRRFNPLAVLDG
jgi:hypothetical protein